MTLRQDAPALDGWGTSVWKWRISAQLVMFEETLPFLHLLPSHRISLTDIMTAR